MTPNPRMDEGLPDRSAADRSSPESAGFAYSGTPQTEGRDEQGESVSGGVVRSGDERSDHGQHPMSDLFRGLDGVASALEVVHQTLPPLLAEVDRLRAMTLPSPLDSLEEPDELFEEKT